MNLNTPTALSVQESISEMIGTQNAPFLIEDCVLNNREMEV